MKSVGLSLLTLALLISLPITTNANEDSDTLNIRETLLEAVNNRNADYVMDHIDFPLVVLFNSITKDWEWGDTIGEVTSTPKIFKFDKDELLDSVNCTYRDRKGELVKTRCPRWEAIMIYDPVGKYKPARYGGSSSPNGSGSAYAGSYAIPDPCVPQNAVQYKFGRINKKWFLITIHVVSDFHCGWW